MSSKPPKILDPLRARIRRFQFTMGLGFIALVIGSLFTGAFMHRVAERAQDLPELLVLVLDVTLRNLWVLGVLPVVCYGAARVLELRPMSTALGAGFTGQFFSMAIISVSGGVEALWADGWLPTSLRAVAFFGGVLLSYRAVLQGRAAAARDAAKAQSQAEAKKSEYQDFLREAERAAEKTAQREAERSAVAAAAPVPAEAPMPVSAAPAEVPAEAPAAPSAAPAQEPAPKQEPAEPKASTGS